MSKKNKGGKTPSAKAQRNLEALKKAKEAAEVKETNKESSKEEPLVDAQKPIDQRKGTFDTPCGKTAYETHILCSKSTYMALVSTKIEKDKKGVENIKAEWKNNETGETVTTLFPVSNVKEGDGIDVQRIREGIKNPIPGKMPEPTVKEKTEIEEKKPDPEPKKKEEKKKDKKPTKKEEVIEVEEVLDVSTVHKPGTAAKIATAPNDRIDANHSVDLMNAILKRREDIKEDKAMYQATGKQADLMMFVLIQQWNNQFKSDAEEQGFKVNEEMFSYLNETASLFLGVNLLPNKTSNGQLELNFAEALAKTNPETRKAIEADAKALEENKKESNSTTVPTPEECVTDEQKIRAMRTIMNMRDRKSGGIGRNITNLISFAKTAYNLGNNAEPAQVLATVIKKLREDGAGATLIEGSANAVWGNLNGNLNVLAAHGWLKNQLTEYNDSQVSNIVKVLLSKVIEDNVAKGKGKFDDLAKNYSTLVGGLNDDLINRIISSAKNEGKGEDKLTYPNLKIAELKGKHISAIKTVNNIKLAYGTGMADKLLKETMQKVNALYLSTKLNPLDFYVEKSAYVTTKK